ncbi:MAG: O-antigen ligase family protein, partial [Candidatus Omnitrophota bacterium]
LHVPIFLFAFLGAVSLLRGSMIYGDWYFGKVVIPLKQWLTPLLIYFLVFLSVRDERVLKNSVGIIMACVAVVGLMAIKDYIDVGPMGSIEKERIGAIAEQPNMLAVFFVYYMFLFAAFWFCNLSKLKYWLLLIPFLLCFRGIQVTFSRGGYLAFFTGLFALAFFRGKRYFFLGILLVIFALMNPAILPQGIVYRLFSTFKNVEGVDKEALQRISSDIYEGEGGNLVLDGSAQGRLDVWKGGMRIIADHPFWGTGYDTFGTIVPYYAPELHGRRLDAHNSYIIIAAEMGIPALLVFLWIVWVAIWKSRWLYRHSRNPFYRAMALGFLAGLFGLLMGNMFGSRLDAQEVSGHFWVLCALVMRAIALEKTAKPIPVKAANNNRKVSNKKKSMRRGETVHPKSLSASLKKFDEWKYEKENPKPSP